MPDPHWTPPEYLSPSQISSLMTCGEQYRLSRVVGVDERPMWGAVGGTAVHTLTEFLDLHNDGKAASVDHLWPEFWQKAVDEYEDNPHAQETWYVSARGKETPEYWQVHGPKFVKTWLAWRQHNGLTLWEVADPDTGEVVPAVELEVWAHHPSGLAVRSIIDRVYVDDSEQLRIVDLKTGSASFLPAWPLQMALNNLGLESTYDVRARWAGFWSPRRGGVAPWHDLDLLTSQWTWNQVRMATEMRDQQLFLAHPNALCNTACGVRQWCVAMGGTPHPLDSDATLTHNSEE